MDDRPTDRTGPARDLEPHRVALVGHCYRMLGCATEAEDAAQEALVKAWQHLDRFEGRSSLRSWLYRIATRVCLDMLRAPQRRAMPMDLSTVGDAAGPLPDALPEATWLQPVPDVRALPADGDPGRRAILRQSTRLAFIAALQHLPPKQRAVLLLREVLGFQASEVADLLETSVPAVNSALQRARSTLSARQLDLDAAPDPLDAAHEALLSRYVEAFERYDMDALADLLHEDVITSMPPYPLWLWGREASRRWMLGVGAGCRGSRLVRTSANGQPAFGQYRQGGKTPWALVVLQLDQGRVAGMHYFLDTDTLFPLFGLPPQL